VRSDGFSHASVASTAERTRVPMPASRRAANVPISQNEAPVDLVCTPPTVVVTADVTGFTAVTALVSSVTAPFRASVRPVTRAPVVTVMLVNARMFPANDVVVPIVAELPTCQNTFPGDAPFVRTTDEPLAVVSVLPILKMNTSLALPPASSVRVPVNCAEEEKQ